MGNHSSKIKDFIFVTSSDLDPPELHAKREYNPTKNVDVSYGSYGAKKYWKESATQQQIKEHQQKIKSKEDILKQFRHYQDFDRIDYKRMNDQVTIFQYFLEEQIKVLIFTAFCCSRMFALYHSLDYFTVGTWRKLFWPCFLALTPAPISRALKTEEFHVVNHQYFRMLPQQQSQYVQADLQFNMYKDVQDIKYNYKYANLRQYYKTRRRILETERDSKKSWYKQLFQYQLGTKTEPLEQFSKMRSTKRKGNWQILTPDQKKIIQEQLRARQMRDKQSKSG